MLYPRTAVPACLTALAAGALLAPVAFAEGTPLSVSGFNADLVVEIGSSAPYTDDADNFDLPNTYAYNELGLNGSTVGLPVGGTIVSDTIFGASATVFQIADYSSDNALLLTDATPTGTLTLNTPTALNSISFLAASTNGNGNPTVVITFADTSTLTTDIAAPDWFFNNGGTTPGGNSYNHAIQGTGRMGLVSGIIEDNGTNPDLFETVIDLGGQTVTSIAFTYDNTNTSMAGANAILAVSGDVVPEPGSLALLGLGGLAMLRRH